MRAPTVCFRPAIVSTVFLVGTRKVYNFHTVTHFQCGPSGMLAASFAGYGGGKGVRNGQAVRNREGMVWSGRMTGFVSRR